MIHVEVPLTNHLLPPYFLPQTSRLPKVMFRLCHALASRPWMFFCIQARTLNVLWSKTVLTLKSAVDFMNNIGAEIHT